MKNWVLNFLKIPFTIALKKELYVYRFGIDFATLQFLKCKYSHARHAPGNMFLLLLT